MSRASALALTELGVGLFVVMGHAGGRAGAWALPAVVAATLLAVYARRLDVASWGLLLPGGLPGRVERAFGRRGHRIGAAAVLTERLLLAAFASVIVGEHFAHLLTAAVGLDVLGHEVTTTELAAVLAIAAITILWIRMRLGHLLSAQRVAHGVWLGVAVLGVILALATWSLWRAGGDRVVGAVTLSWPAGSQPIWDSVTVALLAFGLALPTVGGGDALTRLAHEFPAPRLGVLRRTARIVMSLVAVGTVLLTIAFLVLVPADSRAGWADIPLAGLIRHLSTPGWVRGVLQAGLGVTTLLFLVPAIQACMVDAGQLLRRLAAAGVLPEGLAMPHPRLGTLTKSLDVVTAASVLLVLASAGRVAWLAGAYAAASPLPWPCAPWPSHGCGKRVWRASRRRGRQSPGRDAAGRSARRSSPWPWPSSRRSRWGGATAPGSGVRADARAHTPALQAVSAHGGRKPRRGGGVRAPRVVCDCRRRRPGTAGNILVAVRHPHALEHVAAALQGGADREVVVMTVRLHGVDTDGAGPDDPTPTARGALSVARGSRSSSATDARFAYWSFRGHRARRPGDGGGPPALSAVYVGESATLSSADRRGCSARRGSASRNRAARRPARGPSPQRARRHLLPGGASAGAHAGTSTSFTACGAKPHARDWPPRPPPRRRQGGAHAHGRTT